MSEIGSSTGPFSGRWREIVCIASGPSLRVQDCELVRVWADRDRYRGVIVTNTTFRLCPWADVLYAMDRAWWERYLHEVRSTFLGALVAPGAMPGVHRERFSTSGNTGAGAVALAAHWGVARVVLLGYDCQTVDGKAHWHADHPIGLGNAGALAQWPSHFRRLLPQLQTMEVINATRETALDVFPLMELEDALAG